MTGFSSAIFANHQQMLRESRVHPDIAAERGIRSMDTKATLEKYRIAAPGREVPGLLFPIHSVDGQVSCQYRPDVPRLNNKGKPVKYETPYQEPLRLDLHPRTHEHLRDPEVPLVITEGIKKVDSLLSAGALAVVGLMGVWGWRGTDPATGGKTALADWNEIALNGRDIYIVFDHDVVRKEQVRKACTELARFLRMKKATPRFVWIPDLGDGHTGVDDYLADGGELATLWAESTIRFTPPRAEIPDSVKPAPIKYLPQNLDQVHEVFRKWFGDQYDMQYLDIVLAAGAAGLHLEGNPLWLQIIGGSGVGKTETTAALELAGTIVVSTVSGPAAFLSGTSNKEMAADATGGLLKQIGDRGTLVLKDFTSILSMSREKRAEVLANLREIYDGVFVKPVGTDGGKVLEWRGRIAVISCVTGAYDEHYAVVAAMGERFLLLRLDSESKEVRRTATKQILRNGGKESVMRDELGTAVAGLLTNCTTTPPVIPEDVEEVIVDLADVASLARSQVAKDFHGDPEYAHAPEMPTRIAQQLMQLWWGCRLIGLDEPKAEEMLRRVIVDTIPPDRRKVLLALEEIGEPRTNSRIADHTGMSRKKVSRTLRELTLHRLVQSTEIKGDTPESRSTWLWDGTSEFELSILRTAEPEEPDVVRRSKNLRSTGVPQHPDPPNTGENGRGTRNVVVGCSGEDFSAQLSDNDEVVPQPEKGVPQPSKLVPQQGLPCLACDQAADECDCG